MRIIDGRCQIGTADRDCMVPDELLKSMDDNDIEKSIVVPQDSWTAVYNSEGNDFVDAISKKHPGRFFRFAVANPWYGKKAAEELKKRLEQGFNGVYFKSTVQGFTINDKIVFPLIELCEKYSVPAYFHTGTPVQALPFHLMYLARRFPGVNFIMGHMGAYDFVGDAYASAQMEENIYLDTSLTLTLFMRTAAEKFLNKVVFGSGAPRSTQAFELKKIREAVNDQKTFEKILADNMLGILGGSR